MKKNLKEIMNCKFLLAVIFLLFSLNSYALAPEERLEDSALEERAMNLFLEVRCLVCDGQVIENSDTEFSFAMRKSIRDRISAGKTDQKIKDELRKEFGDDILITPNFKNKYLLFLLPILFALGLAIKLFRK